MKILRVTNHPTGRPFDIKLEKEKCNICNNTFTQTNVLRTQMKIGKAQINATNVIINP